jgi:Zn-dependent membrane protease YugP
MASSRRGLYPWRHASLPADLPMHPALIVLPIVGALFGPRLWAAAQLRKHDLEDGAYLPADELARRLLDRHGLTLVRVEVTDVGDHYDPLARAVRINRARFHRASLTAATTAAHEVGHALQHASGYWAFRLHHALSRLARVTTGVGGALLLLVPVTAILSPAPTPTRVLSLAATAMLGTGLGAQLTALPAELDASFGRAMPLLRDCCLSDAQAQDARRILLACSLTYLASAAAPALVLGPWVGRGAVLRLVAQDQRPPVRVLRPIRQSAKVEWHARRPATQPAQRLRPIAAGRSPAMPGARRLQPPTLLRLFAKPAIRAWLLASGKY